MAVPCAHKLPSLFVHRPFLCVFFYIYILSMKCTIQILSSKRCSKSSFIIFLLIQHSDRIIFCCEFIWLMYFTYAVASIVILISSLYFYIRPKIKARIHTWTWGGVQRLHFIVCGSIYDVMFLYLGGFKQNLWNHAWSLYLCHFLRI